MEPKRLYLDLNHWIGLAKARKDGDLALETKLASLVDQGKVIIPISATHMMEICSILKERRRQDLAEMLRALSRGAVLRPLLDIRYLELESRIGRHYGRNLPEDIRPVVVGSGYYRAFGELNIDFEPWREIDPEKSAEAESEVWNQLNDDKLLDMILSMYSAKIPKDGTDAEALRASLNQTRLAIQGIEFAKAEQDCVMGLGKAIAETAVEVARGLKLSDKELSGNPPSHFWTKEYLATIPTVNVWAKLQLYLAKGTGMDREMTVNDLYDMGHLAVAVPYCDIVVADKAMAHLVKFRKLHETYGTQVYASLEECVADLE